MTKYIACDENTMSGALLWKREIAEGIHFFINRQEAVDYN